MSRIRISITLPEEIIKWIDEMVEKRIYASRSHAIERIILEKIRSMKGGEEQS